MFVSFFFSGSISYYVSAILTHLYTQISWFPSMQLETRVQHRVHFEETLEGTSIVLVFDFCFLVLEQAPSSSSFNLSFFFCRFGFGYFFLFL